MDKKLDTPLTDAVSGEDWTGDIHVSIRYRNLARQLERDRAALREALDGMVRYFGDYPEWVPSHEGMAGMYAAKEQARAALEATK